MRRLVTTALAGALAVAVLAPIDAEARTPLLQRRVIHHLNARAWLSQGVRMWLHPQAPHAPGATPARPAAGAAGGFGTNVDAADPSEDLAGGQSETAIAAGTFHGQRRVLVGWNDITGQFAADATALGAS